MNWKKSLSLGALAVMAALITVGCGSAAVNTSIAEQTPVVTQPAPETARQASLPDTTLNSTMPLLPGRGMLSDNNMPPPAPGFSNNGTMPGGIPPTGFPPAGPGTTRQGQ